MASCVLSGFIVNPLAIVPSPLEQAFHWLTFQPQISSHIYPTNVLHWCVRCTNPPGIDLQVSDLQVRDPPEILEMQNVAPTGSWSRGEIKAPGRQCAFIQGRNITIYHLASEARGSQHSSWPLSIWKVSMKIFSFLSELVRSQRKHPLQSPEF